MILWKSINGIKMFSRYWQIKYFSRKQNPTISLFIFCRLVNFYLPCMRKDWEQNQKNEITPPAVVVQRWWNLDAAFLFCLRLLDKKHPRRVVSSSSIAQNSSCITATLPAVFMCGFGCGGIYTAGEGSALSPEEVRFRRPLLAEAGLIWSKLALRKTTQS